MNTRISAKSLFVSGVLAVSVAACDSNGDAQQLSNLVNIADTGYTSLVINGDTEAVIETGGSTQLSLELFVENGLAGTAISASSADWRSADTSIADVDSQTGIVVGGNVDGEVAITARFGNLSATTQVRVSSAELQEILIASAMLSVNECSDTQLSAMGVFAGEEDSPRDITDSVEWRAAQTSATVDNEGLLRVTAAGELTVTATRPASQDKPQVVGTDQFTVLDNLEGISIVPDEGELRNGSPLQYRALPVYSDQSDETSEITDNVDWTITDMATSGPFASVDNTLPDKGLVTPSRAGAGVLIATCIGTNITESLNITAVGSNEIAGINIEAENSARDFPLQVVWRGDEITEQLVAEAVFLDREGSLDVTNDSDTEWSITSDDNNVFSIDNDGNNKGELTIRGEGRATVSVTFTDDDDDVFTTTATIISAVN